MQLFRFLVAFIFLSQACAGVVYPEARGEHSLLPVVIEDTKDVALIDTHPSRETSLSVRSGDGSLASGSVTWSFSGNKLLIGLTLFVSSVVVSNVCSKSGAINCAIAAGVAVFASFFSKWVFSDRSLAEDGGFGADTEMYLMLPPTPQKSHVQRLATELEPGTWHTVGTMRVGMFNHTIHYHNNGAGIHKLRAWQRNFVVNGTEKRAEDDNDGTVVDYMWQSTNEQAYDDFHSSSDATSYFAANSMGYMINSQSAVGMCADFADGDGKMDEGVLTAGWNNEPFEWADGEEEATLGDCKNI
ncbi:hypothetical protein EW026_g5662 [Hermanssonia centrifuga]|uniref:Uncharacterized protein n=2 Tax=Hermanssonia centrifuga TaxID=98765 RepID=A0A2R6QIT4_9APHY|nr:hypothetical protein PHLCEN_2v3400 [Hermanssonia centrifuga]THG96110.1 hypothetical protein EW026_g5662 [Hermanssonia centrifuga]